MRMALLLFCASLAPAQEIMPARATPGDYPASAQAGPHTLAADFLGHTVPAPESPFVLIHYIVVEAAAFPDRNTSFTFVSERFSLKLNGKTALLAQLPGMVAASVKYPSWDSPRQMTAEAGVGNAGVILGRDRTPRFPGDRRAPQAPPGSPPTVQTETGAEPWDWVGRLAWQDGPFQGPSAGLLYFPYRGNLAKLKTVQLIYNGPEGLITLPLRASGGSPTRSAEPARKP